MILLASFISGFAIMAIELLGGRLLSPWFGGSIYVWGSLITIFMLALSLGYLAGGQWSLQQPTLKRFSLIYAVGGLMVLPVIFFGDVIMSYLFDHITDPRYGSLMASFALFFLPSFILGMASPYAVRLLTHNRESSGASAGFLYFISTLGSAIGTLATSFYLVAWMELNSLLYSIVGLLLLTAALLFWRGKK